MLRGFKEFITRGNVIELAVAVAIGGAFATLVKAVLDNVISPIVNAIGAGDGRAGLGVYLRGKNPATFINISAIVNAFIVFLVTAAAIYFLVVVPMNRINAHRAQRRANGETADDTGAEAEPPSEELLVLRQIRDLLQERRQHER